MGELQSLKAAQSSLAQAAGAGPREMRNGLMSGQVRDDARFEFEPGTASNQLASPMSVKGIHQIDEKFDAAASISL